MPDAANRRRFYGNWQDEANAVYLYEKLARAETNAERAGIFLRLAEVEKKHARVWETQLQALGADTPRFHIHGRTRILSWLAGRFGVRTVLPSLAAMEQRAVTHYDDQPEAVKQGSLARNGRMPRCLRP
jgi:rubrerythrin